MKQARVVDQRVYDRLLERRFEHPLAVSAAPIIALYCQRRPNRRPGLIDRDVATTR